MKSNRRENKTSQTNFPPSGRIFKNEGNLLGEKLLVTLSQWEKRVGKIKKENVEKLIIFMGALFRANCQRENNVSLHI